MLSCVSLANFAVYTPSLKLSSPTKRIAILSIPGEVHLPDVLNSTLVNAAIEDIIYTTSDASSWMYSLALYNTVMLDFLDSYSGHVDLTSVPQKYLVAFMDHGGSVMFSHDTITSSGWDPDIYKYCGISTSVKSGLWTAGVYKYSPNACHQIFIYPNDMTTVDPLDTSTFHDVICSLNGAALLYGYGTNFEHFYLLAMTNATSTQRCIVTSAGHTTTLTSNENKVMNNVAYWLLYNHYGEN